MVQVLSHSSTVRCAACSTVSVMVEICNEAIEQHQNDINEQGQWGQIRGSILRGLSHGLSTVSDSLDSLNF